MATPKRVRPRAPARKKRKDSTLNPARFLPTHERYTPELLLNVRKRFEETPEPVASMAADLDIEPSSLNRIARRYGWLRRNPAPARDVSPALRILQAAQALEAAPPAQDLSEVAALPEPSTIDRLERAVLAELATIEAMRAALGRMPQKPPGAQRTVRTLSILTQTLQHLQRLRANQTLTLESTGRNNHDDDDMPTDIDEFRRELARRIDAFVASRTDAADVGGDAAAETMDEAR